jgi:hypothetical protein
MRFAHLAGSRRVPPRFAPLSLLFVEPYFAASGEAVK